MKEMSPLLCQKQNLTTRGFLRRVKIWILLQFTMKIHYKQCKHLKTFSCSLTNKKWKLCHIDSGIKFHLVWGFSINTCVLKQVSEEAIAIVFPWRQLDINLTEYFLRMGKLWHEEVKWFHEKDSSNKSITN